MIIILLFAILAVLSGASSKTIRNLILLGIFWEFGGWIILIGVGLLALLGMFITEHPGVSILMLVTTLSLFILHKWTAPKKLVEYPKETIARKAPPEIPRLNRLLMERKARQEQLNVALETENWI